MPTTLVLLAGLWSGDPFLVPNGQRRVLGVFMEQWPVNESLGTGLHTGIDVSATSGEALTLPLVGGGSAVLIGAGPEGNHGLVTLMYRANERTEGGGQSFFLVSHVAVTPRELSAVGGQRYEQGDVIGYVSAVKAPHFEILQTPPISDLPKRSTEYLVNPLRNAFGEASWCVDSVVPVIGSVACMRTGAEMTLEVDACDPIDDDRLAGGAHSTGIYQLTLSDRSGVVVQNVVFDVFRGSQRDYYSEGSSDSFVAPPPPNPLRYKLVWPQCASDRWIVTVADCFGNAVSKSGRVP